VNAEFGMRKLEIRLVARSGLRVTEFGRCTAQGARHTTMKEKYTVKGGDVRHIEATGLRLEAFQLLSIIVLFLILAHGIVWGSANKNEEPGSLAASLDRESIEVGGVVWLTLDYRLPEGGHLTEKTAVEGLDGLTVLKQIITPAQIRIQLLVDQLEPWQSAPIRLDYQDSQGRPQVLTADPVTLQIQSNLGEQPEEAQLRPILDIIAGGSPWYHYLLWAAVIAAAVMTGLGLFRWYRKRRRPAIVSAAGDPAHVLARRAIEQLSVAGYFEKGLVKKHYFVFSEILRRYLEAIRKFPAAEYTTQEIAQHIRSEQDRQILPLLQRADLVKFADDVPTPARKEEDIRAALAYISQTGPDSESGPADGNRPEAQP
jgi:hypothetical protein